MLFFANNVLFWLPGDYDSSNFVAAAVAVLIAAVSAWFSGKIFSGRRLRERVTWQQIDARADTPGESTPALGRQPIVSHGPEGHGLERIST